MQALKCFNFISAGPTPGPSLRKGTMMYIFVSGGRDVSTFPVQAWSFWEVTLFSFTHTHVRSLSRATANVFTPGREAVAGPAESVVGNVRCVPSAEVSSEPHLSHLPVPSVTRSQSLWTPIKVTAPLLSSRSGAFLTHTTTIRCLRGGGGSFKADKPLSSEL